MTKERMLGYVAFLHLVAVGRFGFTNAGRAIRWAYTDNSIWKIDGPSNVKRSRVQEAVEVGRANRNGYRRIPFRFLGHRFEIMEHVAYFIHKKGIWPTGEMQINHKDLDRSNGTIDNLELMTQSENIKHANAARRAGKKGGKR